MKRCEKYEDFITRFVHGEILVDEREELERHLAVCARCEALYTGITDADRVLRDLPGKTVDPPAYLRQKILAGLPERRSPGAAWGWSFGRWAALAGGLAACALIAFAIFRGVSHEETRMASAPPAGGSVPSSHRGMAAQPGEPARSAPAPETARAIPTPPKVVAAAPKVQIIKEVKIFFYYPPARKVAVTGDFNGWDPEGLPLRPAGKPGLWTAKLRLKPGAYSYNFIVDGERLVPDPDAPAQAPDGYGGTNSIMLVKGDRPT